MTCFHPLTIWLPKSKPINLLEMTEGQQKKYNIAKFTPNKNYYELQVPCGHCIGCKLDRADMWGTRCMLEAKNWNNCCFVTLTYNNGNRENGQPNLPTTERGQMTLFKKDIQDFLKRLRFHHKGKEQWENPKTGKIEKPIRYFCCGEYGPKGGRPHYHMAIFNWKPDDLKFYKKSKANGEDDLFTSHELQKIWGHGFIVIGNLTHQSANYIARYCQKKAGLKPKTQFYHWENGHKVFHKQKWKPQEEFILMSTGVGIGRKWWEKNKNFVKKYGNININVAGIVKHKPIPRYFKKLWEAEDWEEYEVYKYNNMKKAIENLKEQLSKELYTGINEDIILKKRRERQERMLLIKAKKLSRNNIY